MSSNNSSVYKANNKNPMDNLYNLNVVHIQAKISISLFEQIMDACSRLGVSGVSSRSRCVRILLTIGSSVVRGVEADLDQVVLNISNLNLNVNIDSTTINKNIDIDVGVLKQQIKLLKEENRRLKEVNEMLRREINELRRTSEEKPQKLGGVEVRSYSNLTSIIIELKRISRALEKLSGEKAKMLKDQIDKALTMIIRQT